MRSERSVAVLMLIITGEANTRYDLSIKLNCSLATISRAITDINCSMADYFGYYFQIKFINNKYQLIHEDYSPIFESQNLIFELKSV